MQPGKENVYTLIDFDNSNKTLPSTFLLLLSAGFVTQFSVIKFYNGKSFHQTKATEVNCETV